MQYGELIAFLENVGKDPSRLIFEDELTGVNNRRFLLSYLEHKVRWDSGVDYPFSLLFIDLDQFKEINDNHGHDVGDQVLIWIATLLGEVAGDGGMPIRYGGDEFALLLPGTGRHMAREMADRLLQRARDRHFRLRDTGLVVPLTLSIGVATAPDDGANSRDLFHAADTALYHAKQSGRDQAASAAEIDPEKVFPKTALHRLKGTGIVGREEEMNSISEALELLHRGQSGFLAFEATPGMGKTTLLETVRRNLSADDTFWESLVSGDQQEGYRPYYMTTRILLALLNQREDKGADVFEDLDPEEISYLSYVLPHLSGAQTATEQVMGTAKRQAIFAALARFIPRLVDRPLVLLIDDLQFVDEATLLLLRVLIQRDDLNLLVCGASLEPLRLADEHDVAPLERFYADHQKELDIRRVKMRGLSEAGILEYLHGVFPTLKTPDDFERQLARVTQGNPLFLGEIVRKLVADRKVNLSGQQWVIEPLPEGYLPRSLEEIVKQKIAALDVQERRLLERASTMGEDVPLSVLAGSTEVEENKVLEFLDRAEALGLVSLDFQVNDEIMHFLGKEVLDISYGTIDRERRQMLHEEIGSYQEGLYEQRLLPSASLLAYHFKRSANQQKAQRYEQVQLDYSQMVFDPAEAGSYTGEVLEEEVEQEKRLDSQALRRMPAVLRALMSAVRNIKLYPPESQAIATALNQVYGPIDQILNTNERLHLSQAQRVLLANGQRIDVSGYQALANAFLDLLTRTELQGIVFHRGVQESEIRTLLMTLGDLKQETIDHGFWRSFMTEKAIQHIELRQMRYSRVRRRKGRVAAKRVTLEERELTPDELERLPEILRALQGAAKNAKLYPMDSEPVTRSIERLQGALGTILGSHDALSFSSVDRALLVNGVRVDTAGYDAVAEALIRSMSSAALKSVTFFQNPPTEDLVAFIDALRDPAACAAEPDFWEKLPRERDLSGLAFNQSQYALNVVQDLLGAVDIEIEDEATVEDAASEWAQRLSDEPAEALRDALPRFGKEFLVKGEHELLRRLLHRAFDGFNDLDVRSREKTVLACHVLNEGLILGLQHKFTQLAVDPLLESVVGETEPRVLQELATVLYQMAGSAVQFADYQLASRILLELKDTQRQLREVSGGDESVARLLDRKLDATAEKLLEDDLKSGNPERHERAAMVVGSLGRSGIPLLVEVIKTEKDFRVRQLAASLLAEMGPGAAPELKRALVTEVVVEQRFRILEVIDTITHDLRDELAYSLGDSSPKIRRAAFRLFERLGKDEYIELILPLARGTDLGVAKGAIRSLAHLRTPAAVTALVSILDETEDSNVAVACCQALGEVGHSAAIEPLEKVLAQRKFPFFTRRWDAEVRAAAAMALKQISHPRSAEVLSEFARDSETRVRQLAETSTTGTLD